MQRKTASCCHPREVLPALTPGLRCNRCPLVASVCETSLVLWGLEEQQLYGTCVGVLSGKSKCQSIYTSACTQLPTGDGTLRTFWPPREDSAAVARVMPSRARGEAPSLRCTAAA